jgi:hypothetical protein
MCGVPYHAARGYVARLLEKGFKVAICDQMEEPGKSALVRREVTRVVTPGMILDDQVLDPRQASFLAAVVPGERGGGLALLDALTGELRCGEAADDARHGRTRPIPPTCLCTIHSFRRPPMNAKFSDTETVVRNHLQTFLEQKGLDAILADYADDACFLSEGRAYCGKPAIREFFDGFIAALSPQAFGLFALRSLRVQGDLAYITWSAGPELPLGTDTFVVRQGRIVTQTFAMHGEPLS